MQVTFHGQQMTLLGSKLKLGDKAPDVRVINQDLTPVLPLEQSKGKIRLFLTVPSLDTPVCACETSKFSENLKTIDSEMMDSVSVFLISADLPFAQNRWRKAEGIENITMLSDYRSMDFARNWGLLIQDLGLLARAVYVIDPKGLVIYSEIVSELTDEPDYSEALEVLRVNL